MKSTVLFCLILLLTVPAFGQGLEDNLGEYNSKNGELYLQPLADAFGANINSGWFSTAKIPRFGLHIEIGIKAMAAFITEEQKTFVAVSETGFNPPPDTELPTVFGSEDGVDIPGLGVSVPGVWDTQYFPLAVPQIKIGSLFGTEAIFRWIELNINEDIGKISLFGWGFRHSISQYIPLLPVDLSVGYFRQYFRIGDMIDATASLVGVQASYSLSVLTLYGGFAYESSNLDISYDVEEGGTEVRVTFDLQGANSTRLTLGAALNLPGIKIHADYNIGAQNVASAGIGFGF